jgi:hypothetical protein
MKASALFAAEQRQPPALDLSLLDTKATRRAFHRLDEERQPTIAIRGGGRLLRVSREGGHKERESEKGEAEFHMLSILIVRTLNVKWFFATPEAGQAGGYLRLHAALFGFVVRRRVFGQPVWQVLLLHEAIGKIVGVLVAHARA